MLNDNLRYRLLKILTEDAQISQRDLAARLGISVGKTNYCLRALVEKGFVKINNFRRADNKLAYTYLLTASGIEDKARTTVSFLQDKLREYNALQAEIERLREEVLASQASGSQKSSSGGDESDVPRQKRS